MSGVERMCVYVGVWEGMWVEGAELHSRIDCGYVGVCGCVNMHTSECVGRCLPLGAEVAYRYPFTGVCAST